MKRSESPRVSLYPLEDPNEDDPLDFLPPVSLHQRVASPSRPLHSAKKHKRTPAQPQLKSAQRIQTPSASPRHFPSRIPVTVASTSAVPHPPPPPTTTTATAKRRRASSLVFRNDKDTEEITPRKARILKRQQQLDRETERAGQPNRNDPRPKAKKLSLNADRAETDSRGDDRSKRLPRRKSGPTRRESEVELQIQSMNEGVASQEEQHRGQEGGREEVIIKEEEDEGSTEDEDEVIIKDEAEPAHFREEERLYHDKTAGWPKRIREGDSYPHPEFHESNFSRPRRRQNSQSWYPAVETPNSVTQVQEPRRSPSPDASASDRPIPSLSNFIRSLDLPRLSRLIATFHELGIETAEDVLALASITTAGQRRRDEIWKMVAEIEKSQGREFTKFEQATLKVGLEESRQTWGV